MLNLTYKQVDKELKTRLTKQGVIPDFEDSTQLSGVLTNRSCYINGRKVFQYTYSNKTNKVTQKPLIFKAKYNDPKKAVLLEGRPKSSQKTFIVENAGKTKDEVFDYIVFLILQIVNSHPSKTQTNNKSENRLCKIVWNSNFWIKPMERSWNPSYIDDPNKGYEQQHGFVLEDWLFNPKFIFDGFHYGYIRGIGKISPSTKIIKTVYLFTINPHTKERYYVGKLYNVENLQLENISKNVLTSINKYQDDMINELKELGADYYELKKYTFIPNTKFRVESKELFPTPLLIQSGWFDKKYYRTSPMKMNKKLYTILNSLELQTKFSFSSSNPISKPMGYIKHSKEGSTQVERIHDEMEKSLHNYLINNGVKRQNIACNTTSFGGKLADIVVKKTLDSYDIYEIKTDTDLRRGLREGIGQLLDYATWEKDLKIKTIYVVLPYLPLSTHIKSFIRRLKRNIRLNLEVMQYDKTNNTFLLVNSK